MNKNVLVPLVVLIAVILPACSVTPPAPLPTATPTLAPDKGRVVGVMQVRTGTGVQGLYRYNLYLGRTIKDNSGKDIFVSLDRINSPRATTDEQGRFAFQNIDPGTYGMLLDTGNNSFQLLQPGKEEMIIVTVGAGTTVDLGTLVYDSVPTPPLPAQPYPYP